MNGIKSMLTSPAKSTVKKASDCTVTFIDNGTFLSMCRAAAKGFKKAYYYKPWEDSFPRLIDCMVGTGYPELEVISSPFDDSFDKTDLFVFFDLGYGEMQEHLEKCGKLVWGSRLGEELEFDRELMRETLKEIGLPVGHYEIVTGVSDLRDYLDVHKDVYVKISKFRGTFETFHSPKIEEVEPLLDKVEHDLGPFAETVEFCVEDNLPDKREVAIDEWCVRGKFPGKALYGIEVKDLGYVGQVAEYGQFPEAIRKVDAAMAPILANYNYTNWYSPETRIGKDMKPYMIDLAARAPSPPSELYQCMYTNLADIILAGARGEILDPKEDAVWGAELILHSSWAVKNFQPVTIPKDIEKFVKLRCSCKIDDMQYVLPVNVVECPEIGSVCGIGSTMEQAIEHAKDNAAKVEGYCIEVPEGSMEMANEEVTKARELGVWIKE